MSDASILMKEEQKARDIVYAITIIRFKDASISIAPETSIGSKNFKYEENNGYSLVVEAKSQIELDRIAGVIVESLSQLMTDNEV